MTPCIFMAALSLPSATAGNRDLAVVMIMRRRRSPAVSGSLRNSWPGFPRFARANRRWDKVALPFLA